MTYFHSGVSSLELQIICSKIHDQNIYRGSAKRLNSEITLVMLIGYSE